ncbi:flavodoxin family protein [Amedibacterium intestinale]|uniref:flavodoxin family protein n=1 Tax=Amedibacterium intestinale TaxID=2583452 RepID=UPI000E208E5B
MNILFINGSPNKKGNTVKLTKQFLKNQTFQTLHLVDYKIYSYGQNFDDDQFDEVVNQMSQADMIIIGSPLYWHSMSGAVRNLIDRFYNHVDESLLKGKDFYFVFQGYAPTKQQLESGEYTMQRFAKLYGMNYKGMITQKRM